MIKKIISKNKFTIILGILISSYIGYFSFLTLIRHSSLNSNYYDLAIMNQTVYNTSRGRILELTNPEGINNFNRIAIHNDIIMALIAPFYLIFSGPETLLVVQVIIIAFGAIPIYLLCKLLLKSDFLGIIFSFLYLMYPPLQRANLFDFHAVTLAITFLLFMFYFFYKKKYGISLVFFILSIFSKEQISLTTSVYAIVMGLFAYKEKNKKKLLFSIVILIISALWFTFSIWILTPYFRGGEHFALTRYSSLGNGPAEIIKNIFTKPGIYVNLIFNKASQQYLYLLLSPLMFISLLSPQYLFIAAPEFMINLLSNHSQMRGIDNHYAAVIIPFIFVSTIFGVKEILKRKILNIKIISVLLICFTLIFSYYKGLLPYSKNSLLNTFLFVRKEVYSVKLWEEKLKDENISISASEKLGAHFSQRIKLYRFSSSYKYADYVLILKNDIYYDWLDKKQAIKDYEELKADKNYKMIYQYEDFEVYKKI